MRYLSAAALRRALPMTAAIAAMEEVFRDSANAVLPTRIFMQQPRPGQGADASLGVMPAGWTGHGFGAKIVSLLGDNPAAGRPAIQGVAVLMDPATGAPVLLTDAAALTTRRTAAMAAVATQRLARPDARRLAVIGTGALAADMVAAMRAVRSIETTVLFNRTRARAEDLAGQLGGNVQVADNANGAVAGADIIVLCTTSPTAVVDDRAIAAGAHINAVGNFSAQGSELTLETVARCERWVDSYEGAFSEAGEMILAAAAGLIPEGHAGLRGDLAALAAAPDSLRGDADAVTLYKSVGTALADVGALVAAAAVAARHDLGTLLD